VGKDAKNVFPRFSSGNAVDGRNPAPVDGENLPLFSVFYTSQIPGGAGFLPSTVCKAAYER